MTYVYSPGSDLRPHANSLDETRCAASVVPAGSYRTHQCRRPGKIEEEGRKWCSTHAPSVKQARYKLAREREQARWDRSPVMQLQRAHRRLETLQRALQSYLDADPSQRWLPALEQALKESRDGNL